MAYNPCAVGPHFNPLKNYLSYISWGRGNDMRRYRLRFCAMHIAVLQEDLAEFKVNPVDGTVSGGNAAMTHCLACSEPLDKVAWQVFVTCYPPNNEREDYWSHVHVGCQLPEYMQDQYGDPL